MKIRRIEGLVTAITPVHVSSFTPLPTNDEKNHKHQLSIEMVYENQRHTIPVVPGNTLRGLIRRECADILLEKVGPVSVPVFSLLKCGSVGELSKTGGITDIPAMSKAMSHIYMGLMGGGPDLIPGGFQINNMVPVCKYTMGAAGIVPQSYHEFGLRMASDTEDRPERHYWMQAYNRLVSRLQMTRVDDLNRLGDSSVKDKIENFDQAILDYMEKTNGSMAARKTEKVLSEKKKAENAEKRKNNMVVTKADLADTVVKAKKDTVSMMISLDAISAGTPMFFRLDIKPYIDNAQIFFLAKAIGQVFTKRIGGWSRVGFGLCKPDLKFVTETGDELPLLEMSPEGVWVPSVHLCDLMRADFLPALDAVTHESLKAFTTVRGQETANDAT